MRVHFGRVTRVFLGTLPWVGVRILVGIAFGLVAVLWFGVVLWLVFGSTGVGGIVGLALLIGAVLLFGGFVSLVRKYVLYLVSAGHVATVAHVVHTGEVPRGQLSFGKTTVTDNFVEASVLFAVDKAIRTVVGQFNRTVTSFGDLASFVPGLEQIVAILERAVGLAATHIDEAILAHVFLNDEQDTWSAARDGLVLYGKTWKSVLASTVVIVVGMQALTVVVTGVVAVGIGLLGGIGTVIEAVTLALLGGVGAVFYFGLVTPWITTVVVTTFLIEARDETPDSETVDHLARISGEFRSLLNRTGSDEGPSQQATVEAPD